MSPNQDEIVEFPSEERSLQINNIQEMIENPDVSLLEITKKIAMEITAATSAMAEASASSKTAWKVRLFDTQIKALRELSKTLMEIETISRRDVLNWDGPKFTFVLSEWTKLVKKAMQQSGLTESECNGVLRSLRDLWSVYEPVLRKETERQTGGARGKES